MSNHPPRFTPETEGRLTVRLVHAPRYCACVKASLHFIFVAVVATLAVCSTAGAARGEWVTLTDKPEGFSLTVPKASYFVPNSVSKVQAIISLLAKRNQAGVAQVYAQIIGSSDVTKFVYEGFFFTPSAPVQPLFTLAVAQTRPANTTRSGLAKVATGWASALRKEGATVTTAKVVTLPAGRAALDEAVEVLGGVETLLVNYDIGHGGTIYQLTFRTSATTRESLSTFDTIAKRFAFA
jgi:hypothetical protein